jgi:hypothetical protein
MTNVRSKTKQPTKNIQALAVKNRQAREAAKVRKTTVSNARGGGNVVTDANDENINSVASKLNRRSHRLNPTAVSTSGIVVAAGSNSERLPTTANGPRTRRKASATQATKSSHAHTGSEMVTDDDDDACNLALPSGIVRAHPRKGTGRSNHSNGNIGGQRSADQRRNGTEYANMTEGEDVPDDLNNIQDLRRQLQEEKGYISKSTPKIVSSLTRI